MYLSFEYIEPGPHPSPYYLIREVPKYLFLKLLGTHSQRVINLKGSQHQIKIDAVSSHEAKIRRRIAKRKKGFDRLVDDLLEGDWSKFQVASMKFFKES